VSAARPQQGLRQSEIEARGIDIVLAIDISPSMRAEDFRPRNRLFVAKETAREFVRQRTHDRIGLVAFGGTSFTQSPLTLDHEVLAELLDGLDFGMVEDGTAIGMGLASACNRMRASEAKSKVIILLTDGQNNAGMVDPATAARVAESLGIKVYTIGVGTRGRAPIPIDDPVFGRRLISVEVDIDEATLRKIAELTDGQYFRATDRQELEGIYARIDELERTKVASETFVEYTERFKWLLLPVLGLLILELGLEQTVLRETP